MEEETAEGATGDAMEEVRQQVQSSSCPLVVVVLVLCLLPALVRQPRPVLAPRHAAAPRIGREDYTSRGCGAVG